MKTLIPVIASLALLGCKSSYEHKALECVDGDSGWGWLDDTGGADDTGDAEDTEELPQPTIRAIARRLMTPAGRARTPGAAALILAVAGPIPGAAARILEAAGRILEAKPQIPRAR